MANVKISALPTASTPLTGAELVPIVQSGVTSQTTVDAFNYFKQDGTGAVATTVQAKLRETVSVFDFMTAAEITAVQTNTWTTVTDVTGAIQAALDSCNSLYFPAGIYLTGPLSIPLLAEGATYIGAGYWHYGNNKQTVIKAKTAGQTHIFAMANGADNISFMDMRIDGDSKAVKGIDGTYGAFFTMEGCGVYNCTSYGAYHKQGLARYRRVFFNNLAVGLQLYSDSSISDSEFSGGTIPLLLVAGGNRLVNIWANTGTTAQIRLTPFDASTTHINTSMTNIYVGETMSSTLAPVVDILGTSAQRVQQVMISNSFFVNAAGGTTNINGFINITKANDVTVSGCTFRGQDTYATATMYTAYAVLSNDCDTFAFTGNVVRGVNTNAIDLTNTQSISIAGNTFRNCSATYATGTQGANIILRDSISGGVITGNNFHVTTGSSVPYAIDGQDAYVVNFEDNLINYPSSTITVFASNPFSGRYQRNGASALSARTYTSQGSFTTASGANTTSVVTLPTSAVNQNYIIQFQQNGTGANATIGSVFLYNTLGGAITVGNTNTLAALQNTISIAGNVAPATVTLTIASPCVVTLNSHGLSNGDIIYFTTTGALPTGLSANINYYVVNATTNTFEVSLTFSGTAINTSGTQSGTHTCTLAPTIKFNQASGYSATTWIWTLIRFG